MKKSQFEQANEEWKILKKGEKFDEKFIEKMNELKMTQANNRAKKLRVLLTKLNFGKGKRASVQASSIVPNPSTPVVTSNENTGTDSGRFLTFRNDKIETKYFNLEKKAYRFRSYIYIILVSKNTLTWKTIC